jgi:hypothetical protein
MLAECVSREQRMKEPTELEAELLRLASIAKPVRDALIAKGYLESDGVTLTALGRAHLVAANMEPRRRYVGDLN